MGEIPSLWRTELWHPMLVHLPIATLLLATVAGLLRLIVKSPVYQLFLKQLIPVMLFLGVLGGWMGIYTGGLAYRAVVREICNPDPLQEHQWWSYASIIIFTLSLLSYSMGNYLSAVSPKLSAIVAVVLMVAGSATLLYTGHLGASVVYQQGGGTYRPSADCSEFERQE